MTDPLAAANIIAAARRHRTPLRPLAAAIAPQTEAEGYRIQEALAQLLAADFGARVGYKIGCTSAVMQQYIGIPHPCGGNVFANGVHASGASLAAADFVRVGVECEIAVRLARDLVPSAAPFTADNVADAIEAYLPAIEIVDDRYSEWQTMGAPTLVADDFFAAGCVLGQPVAGSSTTSKFRAVPAPTCWAIRTMRWRGWPIISQPAAPVCARGRLS
jgi:2-keto-4-pentenoate hydratase